MSRMDLRNVKVSFEFVAMVVQERSYLIMKGEDDIFHTVFTGAKAEAFGKELAELVKKIHKI
jgi:hypothetical protein